MDPATENLISIFKKGRNNFFAVEDFFLFLFFLFVEIVKVRGPDVHSSRLVILVYIWVCEKGLNHSCGVYCTYVYTVTYNKLLWVNSLEFYLYGVLRMQRMRTLLKQTKPGIGSFEFIPIL